MLSGLKRIASNKITWILLLALLSAYFRVVAVRETQVDHPIRAGVMDYYVAAYSLSIMVFSAARSAASQIRRRS
jgi:hypothetical protein